MPSQDKSLRNHFLASLIVSAICGTLAGATAGYVTGRSFQTVALPPGGIPSTTTTTSTSALPEVPTTTLSLVPLEHRAANPFVPPISLTRRATPVGVVYRKPKGATPEERIVGDDRVMGQAVALTSDGWFVSSASVLGIGGSASEMAKLSDIAIWIGAKSYSVERGVFDRLNSTVYLKVAASGLTPPAFARSADIRSGAEVWIEARPDQFAPDVALNPRARSVTTEPASSEFATRRILLRGSTDARDQGGAVWDANGSLVGIIESKEGESVRVIPSSSISSSFSSLLANGEIRHAVLGVRAYDLAILRVDGEFPNMPASGAWIHDEKKSGKPGIVKDSPAAKAKLKVGDVILSIERDILDGAADIGEVLAEYRPGASVVLRVMRAGADMDVTVQLGSMTTSEALK